MHHIEVLEAKVKNKVKSYLIACPVCKVKRWVLQSNYMHLEFTGRCAPCARVDSNPFYSHK